MRHLGLGALVCFFHAINKPLFLFGVCYPKPDPVNSEKCPAERKFSKMEVQTASPPQLLNAQPLTIDLSHPKFEPPKQS